MNIVSGTRVWDGKDKYFKVLGIFDKDGEQWVYYREDKGMAISALECQEYSCLLESFKTRFRITD